MDDLDRARKRDHLAINQCYIASNSIYIAYIHHVLYILLFIYSIHISFYIAVTCIQLLIWLLHTAYTSSHRLKQLMSSQTPCCRLRWSPLPASYAPHPCLGEMTMTKNLKNIGVPSLRRSFKLENIFLYILKSWFRSLDLSFKAPEDTRRGVTSCHHC